MCTPLLVNSFCTSVYAHNYLISKLLTNTECNAYSALNEQL